MESPSRYKRSAEHILIRVLAMAFLIVGVVTAALDATFGGFTPIMWFLLGLASLLVATCTEVLRIADLLEKKK
ncbi:MAG: hypothetical protein KJ624_00515 [Chloroflexi bacterium]|nr:hypothetical protein [Chloroflexota bacterium]